MAQRNDSLNGAEKQIDATEQKSEVLSVADRFRLLTQQAKTKDNGGGVSASRDDASVSPPAPSRSISSPIVSSQAPNVSPKPPFSSPSRSPQLTAKPMELLGGLLDLTRRQELKHELKQDVIETRPRRNHNQQLVAVVHMPGRYFEHGHEQALEIHFPPEAIAKEVTLLALKQFRLVPGLHASIPSSLGLFKRDGELVPRHSLIVASMKSGDTTEFMLNDTGEGAKGEGPKTSVRTGDRQDSSELSSSEEEEEVLTPRPTKILDVLEEPKFGVVKSGELLKKTSTSVLGFQPWKRYFFALDAIGLHYYKDKASSRPRFYDTGKGIREEPPKPLQTIHNFQLIGSSVHPEDARRFLLETTLGTFSLQADHMKDSEEWIKLLAARGEAAFLERTGALKGLSDEGADKAKLDEPTGFVKVMKPASKGQGAPSWERRFLVLTEKRLEMFLSVKDSQVGKMVDCIVVANICGFNLPSTLTRTGRCRFDLVVSTDKATRSTSIECDDVEDCRRWVRLFATAAARLRGKVDIYLEPPKKDRKQIEVLEPSDPLRAQLVGKKAGGSNMAKAKNCHGLRQMLSTGDLSRDDEEAIHLAPQYLFACSLTVPAHLDKSDSHYYATIASRELLPSAEWRQQGHSEVLRGLGASGSSSESSVLSFRVLLAAIDHSRARPLRRVQQALAGRECKAPTDTSSLGGKLEALSSVGNRSMDDAVLKRFLNPPLSSPPLKVRERNPKFREDPNFEIRISVYRCKNNASLYGEGEPEMQVLMGYHTMSVREIEPTMQTGLNPASEGFLRICFMGKRHVQAANTERFQHRSFMLQDRKGNDVICHEMLQESPFTFSIPASFLEFTAKTRAATAVGLAADSELFSSSSFPRVSEWPAMVPLSRACLEGMDVGASTSVTMTKMARFASNRKQALKKTLATQERLLDIYQARTCGGLQYKPSTCKTDARLRAIATNLHLHTFTVCPNARASQSKDGKGRGEAEEKHRVSYHTTTVGAFAAHHMGFSENSLQRLQEAVHAAEAAAEAAKLTPNWLDRKLELEAELDTLRQRQEALLSQALSALVNAFAASLAALLQTRGTTRARAGVEDPSLFPLLFLKHMGFVFHFTSLLSTFGDELSMMADTAWAMDALSFVKLRILPFSSHAPASGSQSMEVLAVSESDPLESDSDEEFLEDDSGDLHNLISLIKVEVRGAVDDKYRFAEASNEVTHPEALRCVVELSLPRKMLNLVPPELVEEGGKPVYIEVIPILITQGVNEMQNLAQKLGKTEYQQEINTRSILKLRLFMQESTVYRMQAEKIKSTPVLLEMANALTECGILLDLVEDRDKHKRVRFLELSDWLAKQMEGSGSAVACKSAKDRTACWATYRHGRLLVEKHDVSEETVAGMVSLFRLHGVRRFNVFKNTAQWQYAFNAFQRKSLPTKFRPPEECCGKAVT